MIDHFVIFNSEGSVIHADGQCPRIPAGASMGAALTILEAATALDLPLCPCARDAHDLRTAGLNIRRVTEGTPTGDVVDRLMDNDLGCLVCHAQWVADGSDSHGGNHSLAHARMCIVPVLVWLPEVEHAA
jgi:hypothetical protein